MSAEADVPPAEAAPAKPRRWFRPASSVPQLSADAAVREGRIVRLAFDEMGAAAALTFLNGFEPSLDGRPLAIATASPEGALAVERLIVSRDGEAAEQPARAMGRPVA